MLAIFLMAEPARAQTSAPPASPSTAAPALTLEGVIEAAMRRSTGVLLGEQALAARRGELQSARGGFAPQVGTTLGSTWSEEPAAPGDTEIAARTRTATYGVTAEKRFRTGVALQSTVRGTQQAEGDAAAPMNSAGVSLRMDVPLMRDRLGRATRAPEQAAGAAVQAEELVLRHVVATGVRDAALAYWQYVAAHRRLEVQRASEARAERLAAETRALIEGGERPAADLNQVMATVAGRRVARITAEQGVVDARGRLGRAMGLPAVEVAGLPAPEGTTPAATPFTLDAAALERLAAAALERRADLAAALRDSRAAGILAGAAREELKPRVDLAVSVGYTGVESGAGAGGLFSPLYPSAPGPNASVELRYQLSPGGAEARGRVAQRAALLRQAEIAARDLEEGIRVAVRGRAEALERSIRALEQAGEAEALSRTMLENETKKHHSGASTLFEVILAEDALTGAMLSRVGAELEYASAIAALHFETGAVEGEPGRLRELFAAPPRP
jgi:outer membrane protein TolC